MSREYGKYDLRWRALTPLLLACGLLFSLLAALPREIRVGEASAEAGSQQHLPDVQQHRDQQRVLRKHRAQLGLRRGRLG